MALFKKGRLWLVGVHHALMPQTKRRQMIMDMLAIQFSFLFFSFYLSRFPVLEMSLIHLSICSDPCLSFPGLCPFDFLDLSIFASRCFLVISSRSLHSRYLFSDCFVYSACSILLLFLFCTLHLHYIFFAFRHSDPLSSGRVLSPSVPQSSIQPCCCSFSSSLSPCFRPCPV